MENTTIGVITKPNIKAIMDDLRIDIAEVEAKITEEKRMCACYAKMYEEKYDELTDEKRMSYLKRQLAACEVIQKLSAELNGYKDALIGFEIETLFDNI